MSIADGFSGLYFPCECVSRCEESYSDPWAGVSKNGLIGDGKKEEILNLVACQPRTISQLAKGLGIAGSSVHKHISDLMASELLRDSEEWEKLHPKERYYEPNFPVVWKDDRAEFEKICEEMCEQVTKIFEEARPRFEDAFKRTSLAGKGWEFTDVTQYLYACIQRGARQRLEERGMLRPAEKHRNGVDWTFWAEEAEPNL